MNGAELVTEIEHTEVPGIVKGSILALFLKKLWAA